MERSTRLAHISEDGTRTQTVYDHLAGTARLAGSFAAPFGAQSEAEFAAWLHDVGKYSDAFQLRLKGGPKVDHSTAGAQEAWVRQHLHAAFAVAGHHSGLPDGGSPADDPGDATLFGRSKKPAAPYDGWREVTLPASTPPAWACADPLSLAFFTRMLYSCLVDADFIDTETFMDGRAAPRGSGTDIAALRDIVSVQAQRYLRAESPSPVSVQRNAVLRACLEKGAHGPQGLYTLTVPTGGGKTFASLAFALEHAAAQKMKRVIYVIPYMSIIDQTAAVFSGLLGAENVLADFSNAEYKTVEQDDLTPAQYRQMLASENWDAPVVVTTAVQFFESLYANRSSYCLTTLLCAADRRRQLDDIRQRLKDGLPCRVVSTSLIEAGVDVDFPVAYREQCGLDSLLQTAGRCNREGRRGAEESIVYRFRLDECSTPQMLRQNVSALDYTARHQDTLDTPRAIQLYFNELSDLRGPDAVDKHGILDAFLRGIRDCQFPFAQVAEEFRLIENAARTVYLPVGEGAALCEQLRSGHVTRTLLRKLGVYSVSCYKDQFDKLDAAGALELRPDGSAILTDTSCYSEKTGLAMDVETGIGLYF